MFFLGYLRPKLSAGKDCGFEFNFDMVKHKHLQVFLLISHVEIIQNIQKEIQNKKTPFWYSFHLNAHLTYFSHLVY